MDAYNQHLISKHFERMYKMGQKPWTLHDPGDLLDSFTSQLTKEFKKAKILDIGWGNGWISMMAAKKGHEVWGIDSSQTAIVQAQEAAKSTDLSKLTHFKVGNALDLQFSDSFFDGLIDRGLFHHILPQNRQLYLENTVRVLRPKSFIYLSVFSQKNPAGIGQLFTKNKIEEIFGKSFSIDSDQEDPFPSDSPAHLLQFILRRK